MPYFIRWHFEPPDCKERVPKEFLASAQLRLSLQASALPGMGKLDVTFVELLEGRGYATVPLAPNHQSFRSAVSQLTHKANEFEQDQREQLRRFIESLVDKGTKVCPTCQGRDPECPIQRAIDELLKEGGDRDERWSFWEDSLEDLDID